MSSNILFLNGPNLNLLGQREQSQYGSITYEDLKKNCLKKSNELSINLEFTQSNVEGEIVNIIQNAKKKYDGIIINAGGYTHTSVAILDALLAVKIPTIELHITNIYKREEFRHKSLISKAADGLICGLGIEGYIMALNGIKNLLKK